VAPTQRLGDGTGLAIWKIESVVTVIGVGLQESGKLRQMPLGMLMVRSREA